VIQRLKNIFNEHFVLIIALCASLIVYYRFLYFDAVSWDDPEMVFRNRSVRSFDLTSLVTDHFVGNYIPLTMLLHGIAWKIFGSNAGAHHALNIIFHLINGIFVYRIALSLLKSKGSAGLAAVIFLLHPLQIESVGWISELKNVLWTFFALLSMLSYLKYQSENKQKYLLQVYFFFLLSCLSKPSAVILPLIFICLDIYVQNSFRFKFILNKIPLLLISLLFGIINMKTQSADLFINYSHAFPFYQRLSFAGFALFKYLLFFFVPIKLSALHPYPEFSNFILVFGLFVILSLVTLVFFLYKKKNFALFSLIKTCVISLILVLQFIPFGESLYADRYMYLSLFFFSLLFIHLIGEKTMLIKYTTYFLLILLPIVSFSRASVWKNGEALYADVIKNYPESFVALNSLGTELMMQNKDQEALEYLNKAIQAGPRNFKGYYNRGLLFLKMNQPSDAIKSFNQVLELKDYNKAYVGRASAYYLMKDIPKAIKDAEYVLSREGDQAKALFVLGNCYNEMNQLEKAISVYNKCLQISPEDPDFYFKRGIALGKMQQFEKCLSDLNTCIELNSNYYEAYFWRGVVKVNLKLNPCEDLGFAAKNNIQPAVSAFQKYCQ